MSDYNSNLTTFKVHFPLLYQQPSSKHSSGIPYYAQCGDNAQECVKIRQYSGTHKYFQSFFVFKVSIHIDTIMNKIYTKAICSITKKCVF